MLNYTDLNVCIPLFIIESAVFTTELIIFIAGISYLVTGMHNIEKIVTNGLYNYIRHPQNLGILVMIFPFSFYTPFPSFVDPGIRTGDIMSWILMSSLICISSIIEEKILISNIGPDYEEYRSSTGFFLPKLSKKSRINSLVLWKSVFLVLGEYMIIVTFFFGVQRLLMELGLLTWTRTF
jgi:protein-S-isoprenylcysteine O-methyltransferase Ste14